MVKDWNLEFGGSNFFTQYSRLVHKLSTFFLVQMDKNDTLELLLIKYSRRYNIKINTKKLPKSL